MPDMGLGVYGSENANRTAMSGNLAAPATPSLSLEEQHPGTIATTAPSNAGSQSARLEVPEQAQLLSPHEFPQSLPQLHPSPISVFGVHSECCSLKPDTGLLPQSLCCPPCPDSCPQGYSHAVCTSKHLMVRSASGVGRAPHTFTFQCICRWSSSCKAVLRVPSVNGLYSVHSLIYWAYAFPFASNSA